MAVQAKDYDAKASFAEVARQWRDLILARTTEGRVRAKARGVRFGRKPALTAHQRSEALQRREAGEACTAIARSYNVSHSTISRLAEACLGPYERA